LVFKASKWIKTLSPYAAAAAIVGLALLVDFVLDPLIEVETPFLLFCSAIFLSAWFGGLRPGLVATALAAVVANYFFIAPHHKFEALGLAIFVLEGSLISWFAAIAHHALFERKQAQEQYKQIVETGEEGIWLLDRDWRITFANPAIAAMLGYETREMVGRPIFEFMDRPDQPGAQGRLERADRLSGDRHEFKFRHSTGIEIWAIVSTSPIRKNGEHSGALAMLTDISARKLAEQELARHRDHLEELVSERTRELEESLERLRLSERMAALGTLSAGLGHDMGNLLMPLRVRLDCLEAKGLPPDLGEDLQAIRTVADYLQRLTNGLRLMALNPDDGVGHGEATDLNEWWRDVETFFKNALPRRSTLQRRFVENLSAVAIPRHLLTQAVFNLVHNSGEAMQGHPGQVTVWAEPGESPRTIRLGVSDNGPGMTPETKRRCLEPFFSTKTGSRSTGLGLALVYLIVKKAGGSIEIDSQEGRGTTFVLNVPVSVTVPARPQPQPAGQSISV